LNTGLELEPSFNQQHRNIFFDQGIEQAMKPQVSIRGVSRQISLKPGGPFCKQRNAVRELHCSLLLLSMIIYIHGCFCAKRAFEKST